MENIELSVAGIVTLYNPTDKEIKNILTYIDDIDILYVIDNTEGKDNKTRLPKNDKIKYFFDNNNVGVATALNIGARNAIEDGFMWLLTMDQDTTFNPGVIKKMKEIIVSRDMTKVGIITPWHKTKLIDSKPNEEFDNPNDVMTSGNIINLDIYRKIGGFKDELFIDGIDIEYCLNLHSHGYDILRINSIEIEHDLGNLFYKNIFGRKFVCMNHEGFRRYYIMRNYHYIYDMYKYSNIKFCKDLLNQKHNILAVILFEEDKINKIKYYIKGYFDYKKGIKGKFK